MDDQLLHNACIVQGCVARATIKALGMMSENLQRVHRGESLAYDAKAFEALIDEEQVGWNSIISQLTGRF